MKGPSSIPGPIRSDSSQINHAPLLLFWPGILCLGSVPSRIACFGLLNMGYGHRQRIDIFITDSASHMEIYESYTRLQDMSLSAMKPQT